MMFLGSTQFVFAQQEETPDLEFLEFLGEGIKVENEIIDPMGYREIEQMTGAEPESQPVKDERDE